MKLEAAIKHFSPKSQRITDAPPGISSDRLSSGDMAAALGMASAKASFGMSVYLGNYGLSKEDQSLAIEQLTQYAKQQAPKHVGKLAARRLAQCMAILAKFAYTEYSNSAAKINYCICCDGSGWLVDETTLENALCNNAMLPAEPGAWSLEPGAWSLEPGAWSLEPGAWSLEPGAWSLEPGAWSLEPGAWSLEPGAWSLEPGAWSLEPGAWSLEPGAWSLEPGAWSLEPGAWSLEPGAWSLEPGAWSLEPGAWSLEPGAQPEVNAKKERKLCKPCNGKGVVSNRCRCNGTGQVLDRQKTQASGAPQTKMCPRCAGRGYKRIPASVAYTAITSLLPELNQSTWSRNWKPFYQSLVTKCVSEENKANSAFRAVTRERY